MPHLVELVIKFPIDGHSNPETLIFDRFCTLMKNVNFGQKINFAECDEDRKPR